MSQYYTKIKFIIGEIYLLSDGKNLLALDFKKNNSYKNAELNNELEIFNKVKIQLEEYLNGTRKKFNIPIKPNGTDFQKKAWNILTQIPYGEVLSYGEQAKLMNNPKAQRATGSANGKNPIPIIIPCHRIITSTNKLGGYSGDIKLKAKLLEIEGRKVEAGKVI